MHLTRRIRIQLALFAAISLVAGAIMVFGYIKLPTLLFGVDRYTVTVELPRAGGLYKAGNVTYRGTEVGRIRDVRIVGDEVHAILSLNSDIKIPSDLEAQVHSQSAIGEQYIALVPRNGTSRPLRDGDVIPESRTTVPPDINGLLDAANRGLQAIPRDNLKTMIDESYTAVGGLGPDISRLVKATTTLSIDSRANLDSILGAIDHVGPILDSQAQTPDAIRAWAAHLASISGSLKTHDDALAQFLPNGADAAEQSRQLIDRIRPTLPVLLANLVSIGGVALTYQPAIEQILVLLPQGVASLQGGSVMTHDVNTPYKGALLDFNLNLNAPPPCTTGFLPATQIRPPSLQDAPARPDGDLYCRIPQDAPFTGVRGARNYPCLTRPGKRAPTVKMCESDEEYVPLNDGNNWKGDPNATLSGQDVPQLAPPTAAGPQPTPAAAPPASPPPIAAAFYDPETGSYIGPDGHTYTQTDLARTAPKDRTWQKMLMPPTGN
ncbi:MCE family protein [Mycobacterium sherrisii]|uniref:MCE family protein n=1 Tax=Mycobacterium sherrisii TaxID=243061 RepID=UPI000A16A63B|nr:MlaD family protein [Mycobacterium sherrisii]MCV7032307.1 MCE family protein [Mycobacterium sherrisii]MEC4764274.1 MlaD family protein [Mycobacterium sherrisii]